MSTKKRPDKYIIIRTDRIGEVLLSTVAVDLIKRSNPEAKITFATSGYSADIVSGRDDIEEVLIIDTSGEKSWFPEALSLGRELKKRRFDVAIILNPHKTLHLGCFLGGVPERIGYGRKWGFLLTKAVDDRRDEGRKHEIEYTMDLLRVAGIDVSAGVSPRMPEDQDAVKYVDALLQNNGVDLLKPMVLIHPGSSNPAKMWPVSRYAELVKKIKSGFDCEVVLMGGGEEKALSDKVIKEAGVEAFNVSGMLDLKQLAALIKRAAVFIGNDTGPMHMAAALKVPVIAIFGRKIPGVSPVRWRPWGDGHVVFHRPDDCGECHDDLCPYDYRCLSGVAAAEVFEAAEKILSRGNNC